MFSRASSIGSRLKNWKTKPMCSRRSFVRSLSPSVVISVPAMPTEPDVGLSRPARMCISVDLPDPDGPITAVAFAGAISTVTPAQRVDRGVAFSVSARHVVRDDDRPVLAFAHSSRLLSLHRERRRVSSSPFRPFANSRCVDHSASVETRLEIKRALERARSSTEELLAPVSDDDLVARVSPASRRSRGATRTSLASRSSGSFARSEGRARSRRPRPRLRRVPARAVERLEAPDLESVGGPRVRRGRSRAVARHARAASISTRPTSSSVAGSSSASFSRTSSSRRSRCSRRCSPAPAPSIRSSSHRHPIAHPAARTRSTCPEARSRSARCTSRGRTTTSSSRTRSRSRASASIVRPSRTASSPSFSTPVATAHASTGATPGWAWREREEVHGAALLGAVELRLGADPLRPARADHAVGARSARVVPRGRGVRSLGGQAAADRDRVGARRGLARPRGEVPVPLGPGMDGLRGQPRSPALLPRSRWLVRRRRQPGRVRPDGGATSGSGRHRPSSPTRASSRSRIRSAPR